MSNESRVNLHDIAVELDESRVLDSIEAELEPGRFIGLIGPNGSGKSTLIRTINSYLKPDQGSVLIDENEIKELSSQEISQKIATLPQSTEVSFNFKVEDIIRMGRYPYGSKLNPDHSGDKVEWAMEETETEEFRERGIDEVSGGERQRIILARCLVQDTPVLLLDEPTSSLDINHRIKLLNLIRRTVDESNRAVLAAVHDLNIASRYCDYIYLLSDGEIKAKGEPCEVLTPRYLEDAFDTEVAVTTHPIFNKPMVSGINKTSHETNLDIYVIAGNGSCSEILFELWKRGFNVSTGMLYEGDSDLITANALGLSIHYKHGYTSITKKDIEKTNKFSKQSDATVIGDFKVTELNADILRAINPEDVTVITDKSPLKNYIDRKNITDNDELQSLLENSVEPSEKTPETIIETILNEIET